ncbi:hypothetical protein J7315_00725 [Providencia rettgeri]|uniref:hypothetical protein n=1 Tax=Providencia rettgeri TaxID=587 RepID=UPI001B3930EB|nr:hypothetical protein [Providencia rettgeri]MBQ0684605.1 hypothetical protein [Providencia rettgeri]
MNNAIAIKFNYNKYRNDPEDILNILTGYVKFYKRIGLISLSSINEKDDAVFELVGLQNGSAIAWIKCIKDKWEILILKSATSLADNMLIKSEVSTRDDLESYSDVISEAIINNSNENIRVEPCIDLEMLGKTLSDYSVLSSRLHENESALIGMGIMGDTDFSGFKELNNKFTFNGNVEDILSHAIKHHKRASKFHVNVLANKGDNIWRLEELVTESVFAAKVANNDWLDSYQSGLISPIGPNDLMEAIIEYDEIMPTKGKKKAKSKYKNAKIIEVINIERNTGAQDDLFQKRE